MRKKYIHSEKIGVNRKKVILHFHYTYCEFYIRVDIYIYPYANKTLFIRSDTSCE